MTLIQSRIFRAWGLAAALAVVGPLPAWAAGDAVTVYRGASAAGPSAGQTGVRVERGRAAPAMSTVRPGVQPAVLQVVGGRSLWFVDTASNKLTSCVTRHSTQVGRDIIRCTTRGLPVD